MKRKSLRLRGRDHKEADEKNGCQIFNILNFFLFIVFYSAMRALLVVYFIFCIIVDPWVDSVSLEFDSHVTTGQITNITVSQNSEATQVLNLTKNHVWRLWNHSGLILHRFRKGTNFHNFFILGGAHAPPVHTSFP